MDRFQMERIYIENNINEYKLLTTDDLVKCHGIDYKAIDGYENLLPMDRDIFKTFIINFFNAHGLNKRFSLMPISINFVEEIEYIAADPEEDDDYVVEVKRIIKIIKSDGKKKQLHKCENKRYKDLKIIKKEKKEYLRFELKDGKEKEWYHVTHQGTQWY